jgi:hypothetical protein
LGGKSAQRVPAFGWRARFALPALRYEIPLARE